MFFTIVSGKYLVLKVLNLILIWFLWFSSAVIADVITAPEVWVFFFGLYSQAFHSEAVL